MNKYLQGLLEALAILSKLLNKSLTTAWIFQHRTIAGMDSDKREELSKAFAKYGSKVLAGAFEYETLGDCFTVKQWAMIAMIARGDALAKDFTADKHAQEVITALVASVDKVLKISKMEVPTTAPKEKTTNAPKRTIEIK